jgi:hypothetical protein
MSDLASEHAFRAARRRDWVLVGQSHLLAVPLSIGAFAGLCVAGPSLPFVLAPHYFAWVVGTVWALWPFCYFDVLAMALGPVFVYRSVCYYRHGGTAALLAAGLRGGWMSQAWYRRATSALLFATLPTCLLLHRALPTRCLSEIEPPLRRPRLGLWRGVLALAISLHHLPFTYAAQQAFCVRGPWTLVLPNWLGPCQVRYGYPPGTKPFGCSELRAPH